MIELAAELMTGAEKEVERYLMNRATNLSASRKRVWRIDTIMEWIELTNEEIKGEGI